MPRAELDLLLLDVDEARRIYRRLRDEPSSRRAVNDAQQRLVRALEAYAAAAQRRGLSLPDHLRVELLVYRSLGRSR